MRRFFFSSCCCLSISLAEAESLNGVSCGQEVFLETEPLPSFHCVLCSCPLTFFNDSVMFQFQRTPIERHKWWTSSVTRRTRGGHTARAWSGSFFIRRQPFLSHVKNLGPLQALPTRLTPRSPHLSRNSLHRFIGSASTFPITNTTTHSNPFTPTWSSLMSSSSRPCRTTSMSQRSTR